MSWGGKKTCRGNQVNREDGTLVGTWQNKSRDGKWTLGEREMGDMEKKGRILWRQTTYSKMFLWLDLPKGKKKKNNTTMTSVFWEHSI